MDKNHMMGLMKQMQQSVQSSMEDLQEKLKNLDVSAESGAGLVKVNMDGGYQLRSLKLDPSLLSESQDMIEDLIVAAVNAAAYKVKAEIEAVTKEKIGGQAGLDLSQLFKM